MDQTIESPNLIEQKQKGNVQNQLPDNHDAKGEHGLSHGIEGASDDRGGTHKGQHDHQCPQGGRSNGNHFLGIGKSADQIRCKRPNTAMIASSTPAMDAIPALSSAFMRL